LGGGLPWGGDPEIGKGESFPRLRVLLEKCSRVCQFGGLLGGGSSILGSCPAILFGNTPNYHSVKKKKNGGSKKKKIPPPVQITISVHKKSRERRKPSRKCKKKVPRD